MEGNMEEALRRIHENRRTKSEILDLSGLGLTELPKELWDCVWVEELFLGDRHWDKKNQIWDYNHGGKSNRLPLIPFEIANLKAITTLSLYLNPIRDLDFLFGLSTLHTLDLGSTQVRDLNGLQGLVNLTSLNLRATQVSTLNGLKDLVSLTSLNFNFTQVSDLNGLQGLVNLTSLDLGSTRVSDLNGLQGLVNLTSLKLGPRVSDLKELQGLVNLTSLNLACTQVNDLSVLQDLVNLTSLDLNSTPVSDLSDLRGLVNLTSLYLFSTPVKDLKALQSLINLTTLNFHSTAVSNLSVLQGLVNLASLNLASTPISDLSGLQGLVNLTSLNLARTPVSDLSGLQDLVNLTSLNLDATQVRNVTGLQSLVNLTTLDLRSTQVSDLSGLQGLVNLTTLYLGSTQVRDLSGLQGLKNLTSLHLHSTPVRDLSGLKGLVNLTTLDLHSTPVSDLRGLQGLMNLTSLSLSFTPVSDLSGLQGLMNLKSLGLHSTPVRDLSALKDLFLMAFLDLGGMPVRDLSALKGLVNLIKLDLGGAPVSDLTPLKGLLNLTELDLRGTLVRDLSGLNSLEKLTTINLMDSSINYFPFELLSLPKLEQLHLSNTTCINIPQELTYEFNALPHLQSYYSDLLKDPYSAYDAKQIIVGNGRVGKTSLLKALYGFGDFDPDEDSTHGVKLFNTTLPLPEKLATANLSLWDFGGQELYHATHRIFMQTRALYLIVWDPETEAKLGEESINLHGQDYIFRNYPLSYWLGNVRALSKDAKIIVICNKADDGQERFPKDIHQLKNQYKIDSFISVSAKSGHGIYSLRQRIQYLLDQMPEMGLQMPGSWLRVREKLTNLRSKQQYITLKEYHTVCVTETLSAGSMNTLLRFLHHSGFLFWHEEYLQDQIILDQKWALEAIYQLLDRNGWYPLLKGNALRQRSELAKCWRDYTNEQVNLFMEMMQSCELALKLEDDNKDNPTYLIPEFLSDTPTPKIADIWDTSISPIYHFRFQHPFFHATLMQRFIVRSAKLAERYDLLWRTGLLLKVEDTLVLVQVYPEAGRIDMQFRGVNPANLLERLKNEISEIQEAIGESSFFLSLSGQSYEWVTLEQLQLQSSKGKTQVASTTGEILELAPFLPLLSPENSDRDSEHKAPGLKELSDRESGSQLLQPTAPSSPLQALQNQVKAQLIAANIPAAFTLLRNHLQPGTTSADDLILLQSQYTHYLEELQFDVLSSEERRLGYNRLVKGILELVNGL